MKNMETMIMNMLMQLRGKSADYITKFLKEWGGENGTMADGVINIVQMIIEENRERVIKVGVGCFAMGAVGTASVIGGIHLYSKHKEKKHCREKMEQVAEILRQEAAIANNESTLPVETEVPTENDDVIPAEANPIA